jgi:DNA-binding CsgD family transcriptional regulator
MKTVLQNPPHINDAFILMWWRKGLDTQAIADKLHLTEATVYNRLLHLREANR